MRKPLAWGLAWIALTACGRPEGVATLPGHEVPLLADAQRIGPADPATALRLSIGLAPRNREERQQLLHDLYDPASPLFHHFLTPAEFTERFGASEDQVQQATAFLQGNGMQVVSVSPNRLLIGASATVDQAQAAFGITISRYLLADGRTARANDSAPSVPVPLAGVVKTVAGLDDTSRYQPLYRVAAPRDETEPAGFGPGDLANAYDVTGLYGAGLNGQGQTVAIFELDGYYSSDVAAYFANFGITPPSITNILIDDATGKPQENGLEVDLDIEVLGGLAPGAGQRVYQGPNNDSGVFDTYNQIVTDNEASVVSSSWGECESQTGTSKIDTLDDILAQGAAQGIAFLVASGDGGAYACRGSTLAVEYPASDPWVTGVGGTTLAMQGSAWGSEVVWADSGNNEGGGGGLSTHFAQPSWQSGAGVASGYSNGMRQVPDVSANADPATGDAVYCTVSVAGCPSTGWIDVGGTSAAAPTWAASMILINQYRLSQGESVAGFACPALYSLSSGFHDITSGNNLYYPAGVGFDLASGIGSPDVGLLAVAFASSSPSTPVPTATPSPSPSPTASATPTATPPATDTRSAPRSTGCEVGGGRGGDASLLLGLAALGLAWARRRRGFSLRSLW